MAGDHSDSIDIRLRESQAGLGSSQGRDDHLSTISVVGRADWSNAAKCAQRGLSGRKPVQPSLWSGEVPGPESTPSDHYCTDRFAREHDGFRPMQRRVPGRLLAVAGLRRRRRRWSSWAGSANADEDAANGEKSGQSASKSLALCTHQLRPIDAALGASMLLRRPLSVSR